MIDALISGHLHQKATARTAQNGSRFATAKIRATMRSGETLFVNVITFSATAVATLMALDEGDSLAIVGELTAGTYTAKDGTTKPTLDLLAHVAMTPYHAGRKRKAVQGDAFVDDPI